MPLRVAEALRRAGLRRTRARVMVMEALLAHPRPLSHQDISRLPLIAALDRVTLYRTLDVLTRRGLLHAVQGLDGRLRFRLHPHSMAGCPGDHPHFLCRECGHMVCLENQQMPYVKVPDGAQVEGKQMLVYGYCPDCAGQSKGTGADTDGDGASAGDQGRDGASAIGQRGDGAPGATEPDASWRP